MSVPLILTQRTIPSLDQYLDGTRGETFEAWVSLLLETEANASTERERKALRLMRLLVIAIVEGMNREVPADAQPADAAETFLLIPRAAGYAAINAWASVCVDDAPMRRIIPMLVEEFRHGAKLAADQLESKP
jgi:hypothetical protein